MLKSAYYSDEPSGNPDRDEMTEEGAVAPMRDEVKAFDETLASANGLDVRRLLLRGALEAKAQFELMRQAMRDAEECDNETLDIMGSASAYRSLKKQKKKWTAKFGLDGDTEEAERLDNADEYSRGSDGEPDDDAQKRQRKVATKHGLAAAGTSRHGWGTEYDIGSDTDNDLFEEGLHNKQFKWLEEHAWEFGFYRPYKTDQLDDRVGYPKECWRWSYFPVAQAFQKLILAHIDELKAHLVEIWEEYELDEKEGKHIPDLTSWVEENLKNLHENVNIHL